MDDFLKLLPIEGQTFDTASGKWTSHVERLPIPDHSDRLCYRLKFVNEAGAERRLGLWTSQAAFHTDRSYPGKVRSRIELWLATGATAAEIAFFNS